MQFILKTGRGEQHACATGSEPFPSQCFFTFSFGSETRTFTQLRPDWVRPVRKCVETGFHWCSGGMSVGGVNGARLLLPSPGRLRCVSQCTRTPHARTDVRAQGGLLPQRQEAQEDEPGRVRTPVRVSDLDQVL